MATAFGQNPSQTEGALRTADFDRTFSTGPACRFVLENPRGRVTVRGSDQSVIQVHARRRRDDSPERYDATQVEAYQQGDTVFIRTVLDPSASMIERGAFSDVAADLVRAFGDLFRGSGKAAPVDYDVAVPVGCAVDLKGVSSSFDVTGLSAVASIYTVSGAITLARHQGTIRLQTVSGRIAGRDLDGPTYAESVSGEIHLQGRLSSLAAKTVSGDIDVTSGLATTARYEIQTVSGSATFNVPGQSAASIVLRGVSGDVKCDLPCDVTRDRRGPGSREWQGTLNGGGASLYFQTVSGTLHLRESQVVPDAPITMPVEDSVERPVETEPEPPADVPTSEAASPPGEPESEANAMTVLQKLERGELSVDDALRALDRLRTPAP